MSEISKAAQKAANYCWHVPNETRSKVIQDAIDAEKSDLEQKLAAALENTARLEVENEKLKPRKTAPVQGYTDGIPWEMHMRAYDVYCKRHGEQKALIQGWCRGGFGTSELDMFIPGWRDELSDRKKVESERDDLARQLEEAKKESDARMLESKMIEHILDGEEGWEEAVSMIPQCPTMQSAISIRSELSTAQATVERYWLAAIKLDDYIARANARIKELDETVADLSNDVESATVQHVNAENSLAEMRKERDADKERMDWMETKFMGIDQDTCRESIYSGVIGEVFSKGDTLRESIDAARSQQKEKA